MASLNDAKMRLHLRLSVEKTHATSTGSFHDVLGSLGIAILEENFLRMASISEGCSSN